MLTIYTTTNTSTYSCLYCVVIGCGICFFSNRLMGKVASDKCHKWVFKEPTECEPNISNYWQSSFDAVCIFFKPSFISNHTSTSPIRLNIFFHPK